MTKCPLLAHSGHADASPSCPLLGVERTRLSLSRAAAFDPKRTWPLRQKLTALVVPPPLWCAYAVLRILVRYVDFMDNFLAPTETCHTADARQDHGPVTGRQSD
jgi:hypothetical protein